MWKVGDKCWYLTPRGKLKIGTVSQTRKHLHTDERLVCEVEDERFRPVPVSNYECAVIPDPLIAILRNRATDRLERVKRDLVSAQSAVDSFDSRLQAMLDAALEGESC